MNARLFWFSLLAAILLMGGCAHRPATLSSPTDPADAPPAVSPSTDRPLPSGAGAVVCEPTLSQTCVATGTDQEIFLQVHLKAHEADQSDKPRLPLNLAAVIDRSGSMADAGKLDYVKEAASQMVGKLGREDLFALVIYDSEVQVLFPAHAVTGGDKETLLSQIMQLTPGSATNLSGGLFAGLEEVKKNVSSNRVNRVLLLSDGLANEGLTDRFQLRTKASSYEERGLDISTLGVGLDYNEDLMQDLALAGGGNYYFIEDPQQIAQIFEKELSGLMTVVAKNVEVVVEPEKGVEIENAFSHQTRAEGRNVVLTPSDLSSNEERTLLLKLKVPSPSAGKRSLAQVQLRYQDAQKGQTVEQAAAPLEVEATPDAKRIAASTQDVVVANVVRQETAAANAEAIRLYEAGQRDQAVRFYQDKAVAARAAAGRYHGTAAGKVLAAQADQMEIQATEMKTQAAAGMAGMAPATRKDMMMQKVQAQMGKAQVGN